MRPPRFPTLIAGAIASCLVIVSLTGCSKSSHKATAASSSSVAPSVSKSALTQNTLPAASAIVNDVAKRKEIVLTKCAAVDGGWSASGTAKNAGTADATYAITIFFTNDHATVQDYATASVTVKPGATLDWTASKKFAAATPTNCVLRGVG